MLWLLLVQAGACKPSARTVQEGDAAPSVSVGFRETVASRARAVLTEAPTRVVGVASVDERGARMEWVGATTLSDGSAASADTLFEIGSVSKVFAGIVFADAERRGEVFLDDAIADHLPGWQLPSQDGQRATFRHALTHTLGIEEMMPSNWLPTDLDKRVSRYTNSMFREYLAAYELKNAPGQRYAYTNAGSSLVGLALEHRTGKKYSQLLRERVFEPLGMQQSGYADIPLPQHVHAIDGYEDDETPNVRRVDLSPLAPSCVIRSSLRDMARFMEAALDRDEKRPLAAAFTRVAEVQAAVDMRKEGMKMALGWTVDTRRNLLRKNGQVSGYRCDLILAPNENRGLFVIVNSERSDITKLANSMLEALWSTQL